MRIFICKIFGHKPIDMVLSYDDGNCKTYTAKCERCDCGLFGKEEVGEFSGEIIRSWIKIDNVKTKRDEK